MARSHAPDLRSTLARFTAPPIIIGGCGRSGTTLLASVLSCHPRIAVIGPETRAFAQGAYPADQPPRARPFNLQSLLPYLRDAPETAVRWCEKTPRNVHSFERIVRLFDGRVHLVHVVRDGRDVVCSFHPDDPRQPWITPERWVEDTRAGLQVAHLPQVHTVRYEDLVHRFEPTLRALAAAIGEPDVEPLLAYPEGATLTEHAAWHGQAQRVSQVSAGRWKRPELSMYSKALLRHPDAQALLQACGYAPEASSAPPPFCPPKVPPTAWTHPLRDLPGANLITQAALAGVRRLDVRHQHRAAGQSKRVLAKLPWARPQPNPDEGVFVVGPRCGGSEVLSGLLAAHPGFWVMPGDAQVFSRVSAGAAPEAYRRLHQAQGLHPEVRWVDPDLGNLAFAATAQQVLPRARWLVVTRPPGEMVHSLIGRVGSLSFARAQIEGDLQICARISRWPNAMRVHEAELRHDPETLLRRVFKFLNVAWHDEVMAEAGRLAPHFERLRAAEGA